MTDHHTPPGADSFLDRVRATIQEHGMFKPGARILVGISGGPDSVALLHALLQLAREQSLTLGVAHVNHCLRGDESDRDACFVASLAKKYELPLYLESIDVGGLKDELGLSLEETARIARRKFFFSIIHKHHYSHIALGHHADDNAEWMLLSLIRGAGAGGLSGIPPVNGQIVRPLFSTSRNQILNYCKELGLDWVQDSTNTDQGILRNKIRHQLIPRLADEYNPNISQSLNRLSNILRQENQWMDSLATDILGQCSTASDSGLEIALPLFLEHPLPLQRRVLRQAIVKIRGNTRKITLTHIDDILGICSLENQTRQVHLPDGLQALRKDESLVFVLHQNPGWARVPDTDQPDWKIILDKPGTFFAPQANLSIACTMEKTAGPLEFGQDPLVVYLDPAQASFPLVLRPWRPGDRFIPSGMEGSQKVKKFLCDRKMPDHIRRKVCVLTHEDTILWVVGHRVAEPARLLSQTTDVLVCKVFLA